ncbi:MAG TPA: GAF domain-containing sensor histidine kinase [Anaeromyxobacteraceae bacterium]|nr:GAF domain-containing sensor histidine kinase [Anaeromyxobacteraceae bacterium]
MTIANRADEVASRAELDAARTRAEAAETRARQLSEQLEGSMEVTAALVGATRVEDVLDAIIVKGLRAFGARAAMVKLADAGAVRLVAARGYAEPVLAPYQRTPLTTRSPNVDAFRTGEPIWLGSREAIRAAYPDLSTVADRNGDEAWASVPLRVHDRVVGVLGLSFARPMRFEPEERAFIISLARKCAAALESASTHEAERAARAEAESLALARSHALELEAAARARAEAAEAEARRIGAVQEQLLAVVGHDLRTPLSVITLGAKMLQRQPLDEAAARTVRRIEKSAARISAMIRDLLDFGRVRRGQALPFVPADVDVEEAVRGAVAEARAANPQREIAFASPGPVRLKADAERIAQVTTNLVVNALEHGAPDAPVEVRLGVTEGGVEVAVHNRGEAIAPEVLEHLFEPFVRGASDDAGSHLGLGLFIVREIVRAHGGTVEVRPGEGDGTTFVVRLPR